MASIFLWFQSNRGINNAISIKLNLVSLECLKTTEPGSDEIYFNLMSIDSQGQSSITRIPPLYNLGTRFSQVRFVRVKEGQMISNARLTDKKLKNGESATFIVSLMETDLSLAQPDTLVGAAKVTIRNKNHTIETSWDIPKANYASPTTMESKNGEHAFSMSDKKGKYKMVLKLDVPPKDS